jgi:hypothetical protein
LSLYCFPMVFLAALFYRFPFLRLAARGAVFTLVTIPLLGLARTLESAIPHVPFMEAVALLAGFCYMEAVALVLATRMFKKAP